MDDIQQLASKLASQADKLTQELKQREDAHIERELRFESVKKEMEERYKINDSILHLNVGGGKFSTYKSTLCKFEGSMLEAMFSGRHPLSQDPNGRYFIDRPAEPFKTILLFLQTGNFIWPEKSAERFVLKEELMYYGLLDFIPMLALDSIILSGTSLQFLRDNGIRAGKLVYRRSRDGPTLSKFNELCNNVGPLLLVIKSKDYVFGAFTERALTSSRIFFSSPSSWLFSLLFGAHSKYPALPTAYIGYSSSNIVFGNDNGNTLSIDVSGSISLGSSSAYLAPNYLGLGAYSERSLPIEQLEAFHVTSYVPTA